MSYSGYANYILGLRWVDEHNVAVEVISSPAGELSSTNVRLPENFWQSAAVEDLPGAYDELRSWGTALFDCLLPAQARALYRAALASLPKQSGLRLLLQTNSPRLAAVPWEYAFDAEAGTWLALDPRTPLVRYYALPFTRSDLAQPGSLRVLVVLSAPTDAPRLDLDSERQHLETIFQPLQQAGRLHLTYLEPPASVERMQSALRRGVDALHYVGHGTQQGGQGALLMQSDDGRSHLVQAEEVAMLMRRTGLRLVCLNACQTGTESGALFGGLAPALVQAEIPAVVAMQQAMPDQSALRFTRAFYAAIVDGEPVDAAVTAARIALRIQLGPAGLEWGYPALFMRALDGHLWAGQDSSSSQPGIPCPSCGKAAAVKARYCGNCGAALEQAEAAELMLHCPGCGHPIRVGAWFCARCGTPLQQQVSQQGGGVQVGGQATVTGIVAGQDANVTLSGGDLVFNQGDRSSA